MAMLADKRRKQRWSLNPRGNAWAEDSNKFGQKMLEKMGWKHGKGLGAKEDGIKDHLKVSYKNDSKGMGFKEIEGWTQHEDNFSELLKNLSDTSDVVKQCDLTVKSMSLEEMSQKSRVRVHYHKFTKGKDLSRYSEKDLASIFGKKSLTPLKTAVNVENSEKFVKKGCMVDYFKKKLPNFSLSSNGYMIGSNGVLQSKSEASESERSGFGYKEAASSLVVEHSQEIKEIENEEVPSKKQCKRKLEEIEDNEDVEVKLKPGKKNRKSNNENLPDKEVGEENGDNTIKEETEVGEDEKNQNGNERKKKRKTQLKEADIYQCTFVSYLNEGDQLENSEENLEDDCKTIRKLEKKKKPKNNNVGNGEYNKSFPNKNFQNYEEPVTEETKVIKSEKKKRKNNIVNKQDQINQAEQTFVLGESVLNVKESKKNRKMKLKETEIAETTFVSYLNKEDNLENNEEQTKDEQEKINLGKKEQRKKGSYQSHSQVGPSSEENTPKVKCSNKKASSNTNGNVTLEQMNPLNLEQNVESDVKEPKVNKKEKASKKMANEMEIENSPITLKLESAGKRSKKQKNVNDVGSQGGISNPAFNPRFNNIVIEKHALNTIVESEEAFNNAEDEIPTNQKRKDKKDHCATSNENLSKNAGFDNPLFKNSNEEDSVAVIQENPYEVKIKEKKKKRKYEINDGIENPIFIEDAPHSAVKIKSKKRKLNDDLALDNPTFELIGETDEPNHEKYEVKRKEKRRKNKIEDTLALDNPGFQESAESEKQVVEEESVEIDEELLLNVACIPVPAVAEKRRSLKHRKSVTFSEVVDQKIIHNDYPTQNNNKLFEINSKVLQNGVDNAGYDRQANNIQENIAHMSRTFDRYHAEIENDINEAKSKRQNHSPGYFISEPGYPSKRHVKLQEGTRLSFKNVKFGRIPSWMQNQKGYSSAKKSYRHLIKGDIIVKFSNTNLHEITGYATKTCIR